MSWSLIENKAEWSLRWRHNDHAGVSNHQPHGCLLNRLFRRKSKKTSKLRVTGLCAGNSPGTGEFPAQMASYAENVSIWWRHHVFPVIITYGYSWDWYQLRLPYCHTRQQKSGIRWHHGCHRRSGLIKQRKKVILTFSKDATGFIHWYHRYDAFKKQNMFTISCAIDWIGAL